VLKGLSEILGFDPILHRADICDPSAMKAIFQTYSFHGVIHFAAYKAVGESVQNPLKYYQNNLSGLINILSIMEEFKVKNFVFSSSCTVYGEPKETKEVHEETPKSLPESPYGYTKWIGEQIITDFFKSAPEFHLMNLRYFNPVGAHPSAKIGEFPIGKPNNLLPFVTQTAIGKQAFLTVFGDDYPTVDGTCVRDYIHVLELVNAHVLAAKKLNIESLPTVLNVGTGKGTTVRQVINEILLQKKSRIHPKILERRLGDPPTLIASTELAERALDFKAEIGLEKMIESAI
jgi:UDP-glucose 4-epimerase